ncbi:hypothetical protein V500_01438 [Pseudogymnoascus sp. VKM F-4518 (FW-2643)]|nr:hypothetical protein V500_01438 [Pseudogymnoascus sp. VKM F-4518 (FW-2643)]
MFLYLLASTLFIVRAYAQNNGLQSLSNEANFSKLRPCAQLCFFYTYAGGLVGDEVGSIMSCSLTTTLLSRLAENDCYCRTDLQSSGHVGISTCAEFRCSNTNDVTSAWSVYDNYCTANGYVAAAKTTAQRTATTQLGSGTTTATTAATPAGTPGSGYTVTVTPAPPVGTSKPSSGLRVPVPWSIFLSGLVSVLIPSQVLLTSSCS